MLKPIKISRYKKTSFRTKHINKIINLLFCFSSTAAPTCQLSCPLTDVANGKASLLRLTNGQIYKFDVDTTVTIQPIGTDAQETKVQLQCVAELAAEGSCTYALALRQLTAVGPDGKRLDRIADLQAATEYPVRFVLGNDDRLQSNGDLCADAADTEFSLNIKRAIVSLFQIGGSDNYHDTDVFGVCSTSRSESAGSNGAKIVTRMRDLNACAHREQISTALVTGIVDNASGVRGTPLLNGDYTAEHTINDDGTISSTTITEEYKFMALTSGETGTRARVVTKMVARGSGKAGRVDPIKTPASVTILFKNPQDPQPQKLSEETLRRVFEATVAEFDTKTGGIQVMAAGRFTELIRIMRQARKSDLLVFFSKVKAGTVAAEKHMGRSIYLDALFRTGTSDSMQAIAELMKDLSDNKERRLAYLSMNLVKNVAKDAIGSLSVRYN